MIYVFAKVGTKERWAYSGLTIHDAKFEAKRFLKKDFNNWKLVEVLGSGKGILYTASDIYKPVKENPAISIRG